MIMRSKLSILVLGALITLILAACGSSSAIPPTAAPAAPAPTQAPTAAPPTAAPAMAPTEQPEPTAMPMSMQEPTAAPRIEPTAAPTSMPEPTAAPTEMPAPTQAPQPDKPAAAASVNIQLFQFGPPTLQISPGTTVTWSNQDDIEHSITAGVPPNPSGPFDSEFFTKGGAFSFTFGEPGTFAYFCKRHNSMVGTVVVK
jgi:plastocyanin